MDLDKIKQEWQNEEEVTTNLNEAKILEMLSKKGASSLDKLIKTERIFLWLTALCIPSPIFFWFMYSPPISIAVIVILIIYLPLVAYKLKLLTSLDLLQSSVVSIGEKINKYRKIILWECYIGIPLYVVFAIACSLTLFEKTPLPISVFLAITISMWGIGLVITCLIYWRMYMKNIQVIQKATQEIESFKEDNI